MIKINDLLNRFRHILSSQRIKTELIQKSIYITTGLEIQDQDIETKNNVIYINTKPIYKNEIFLKKEIILAKLKELVGESSPNDIR